MSGHSKWATIKRKKGAADAKRGQAFTKLANTIALAAREGSDPGMNFKLRLAIDKAKAANMPVANIEKSIARGSGQLQGAQIEEITYEGYGPDGVAILVECATDNRNRTYGDVRTAFSKHGGNLAETGAVAYLFEKKGIIQIESDDPDTLTLAAIDAGADDVEVEGQSITVYTLAKELASVRSKLEQSGITIESAELNYVPKQTITISNEEASRKIIGLMESLDALDDVINTHSNFDISADALETASS